MQSYRQCVLPEAYGSRALHRPARVSRFQTFCAVSSLALLFGAADMLRLNPADWDASWLKVTRYSLVGFAMCLLVILPGVSLARSRKNITPLTIVWLLFGFLMFVSASVNS